MAAKCDQTRSFLKMIIDKGKYRFTNIHTFFTALLSFMMICILPIEFARAQDATLRFGTGVPPAVRSINDRSLRYLATTQLEDGSWRASQSGAGIIGICVMAFMASGEDPDYGPYAVNIRRSLQNIISKQNSKTGYMQGSGHGSMYHHGFATLALSEAYGVVSDDLLWKDSDIPENRRRTIGEALELAVRCVLTSQEKNPWGAWRYSPQARDADTTVAGTVLMGVLGARNAGIEIPNEAVNKALNFFQTCTMRDGSVSYTPGRSHGGGVTRAAIAVLVYSIGKRKDTPEYKSTSEFIVRRKDYSTQGSYQFYTLYYMAQALFQCDFKAWQSWNQRTIEKLQQMQQADGSFNSNHGKAYGTGMAVLTLALNYRLLPIYER